MVREGLPELIPNDPEELVLGRFGDRRSVSDRENSNVQMPRGRNKQFPCKDEKSQAGWSGD